jgi:mono/diheme cytochrome c family protein
MGGNRGDPFMNFKRSAGGIFATMLLAFGSGAPVRADTQSRSLYQAKCAVCHGAGGKADTPAGKSMGAAELTNSAAKSDADLKAVIEKGKNKMPAYGKSLKPQEINELVVYIKSLK